MEKYENIGIVGEGSYGLVMKCRHRETGQLVAIKKFIETEEDLTVRKMALREIRLLKKLRHENLVNMIEVFRRKRRFYLVFEYLDHTLLDELESAEGGLGEDKCREHIFQIIRGIEFCHGNNIVHRDIKPENILVSSLGVIKLCDFGFARLLSANGEIYTDYVATRWYRAPELLVRDAKYGKEVDIWAIGCLFAEIVTGDPLFPGESDIDQLFRIVRVMGKLAPRHQQLAARNPAFKGLRRSGEDAAKPLHKLFPSWSTVTLDFLAGCLRMDPGARPTSYELLRHPFIAGDNFAERFLPELRQRIAHEFRCNPLLRKYQSLVQAESAPRTRDDGEEEALRRSEAPRWRLTFLREEDDLGRPSAEGSGPVADGAPTADADARSDAARPVRSCPRNCPTPLGSGDDGGSDGGARGRPHPTADPGGFCNGGAKDSPLAPAASRESGYLVRCLLGGVRPTALPFPPRTQLVRRLNRPPGGILLDASALGNLGEQNAPPSRASRRGPSRDRLHPRRDRREDFSLPNVPGASATPVKGSKKKQSPSLVGRNDVFSTCSRRLPSRPPSDDSRSKFASAFAYT